MSIEKGAKINKILAEWPPETVALSSWFKQHGVSDQLIKRYQRSHWVVSLGKGAYKRAGSNPTWLGAVYALQNHAKLDVHPAGRTALSLLGLAHYLELDMQSAWLFAPAGTRLPAWFKSHPWDVRPVLHTSDFLPGDLGLQTYEARTFTVKISGPARALMECLYLTPEKFDLLECYQIMENLSTLRPQTVQKLLENCHSVKVTRLFLFMAEKAGHAWFRHLDPENIDLGKGKRSFARQGIYVAKYQITIPEELAG